MLKEANGLRVINIPERSQYNDDLINALNDEIVFLRKELSVKDVEKHHNNNYNNNYNNYNRVNRNDSVYVEKWMFKTNQVKHMNCNNDKVSNINTDANVCTNTENNDGLNQGDITENEFTEVNRGKKGKKRNITVIGEVY